MERPSESNKENLSPRDLSPQELSPVKQESPQVELPAFVSKIAKREAARGEVIPLPFSEPVPAQDPQKGMSLH